MAAGYKSASINLRANWCCCSREGQALLNATKQLESIFSNNRLKGSPHLRNPFEPSSLPCYRLVYCLAGEGRDTVACCTCSHLPFGWAPFHQMQAERKPVLCPLLQKGTCRCSALSKAQLSMGAWYGSPSPTHSQTFQPSFCQGLVRLNLLDKAPGVPNEILFSGLFTLWRGKTTLGGAAKKSQQL